MTSHRVRVETDNAPAAIGPYSQAIRSDGLVLTSGQIAMDPATGEMIGNGDVEAETAQVLKNLHAVLEASGAGMGDVLKCTVFLVDMGDFPKVNALYAEAFPDPAPARSCVAVAALPKGARVEIEAIARIP